MLVLFIVIFILSSHLIHFVTANVYLLEDRKPSAISSFCSFFHAILLVMCVYYMGAMLGGALFICHCFKLTYMISWIFDIPLLILRTKNQTKEPLRLIESIFNLSFPMVIIAIFFTIISFYENEFNSMYIFLQNNTPVLIYAGFVIVVLSIVQRIVSKRTGYNLIK